MTDGKEEPKPDDSKKLGLTEAYTELQIKRIIKQIAETFYFNGSIDGGDFTFDFESQAFENYVTKKYNQLLEVIGEK